MNIDGSSILFRSSTDTQTRVQQDRSFNLRTGDSRDDALSAFAAEMAARLSTVPGDSQEGEQGESKNPTVLVNSLTSTLSWIDERFGRAAMTAAAGMIMGASQGDSTEDGLSDGLVRTLQMIENNWGTAAGDQAISKFNGSLNENLNEFFDNGSAEKFLAVSSDGVVFDGQLLVSAKRDLSRQLTEVTEVDSTPSGDETQSATEAMIEALEEYGAPQTLEEDLDRRTQQAQAAYGWSSPVTSQVLDLAV